MLPSSWEEKERIGTPDGKALNPVAVLLVLAAIVAADYFAFRHYDRNYFQWYADQGAAIALLVSLVAVAIELDSLPELISTHPGKYAASWLAVPGLMLVSLGDTVRADRRPGLDAIVTGLIGFALAGVWVCWLIVIGAAQYFVTLVAGAPARSAFAGGRRTWTERRGNTTEIRIAPLVQMPEGAKEIGFASRPVSATSTVISGLLFAASRLT